MQICVLSAGCGVSGAGHCTSTMQAHDHQEHDRICPGGRGNGPLSWHWEVRSVNGRGLDIRLRLPPGFEALEPRIREAVASASRAAASPSTSTSSARRRRRRSSSTRRRCGRCWRRSTASGASVTVRPPTAEGAARHQGRAGGGRAGGERGGGAGARRGHAGKPRPGARRLVRARAEEGARLQAIVLDQLAAIERLVRGIEGSPARVARCHPAAAEGAGGRCMEAERPSTRLASTRRRRCWRRAPTSRRS